MTSRSSCTLILGLIFTGCASLPEGVRPVKISEIRELAAPTPFQATKIERHDPALDSNPELIAKDIYAKLCSSNEKSLKISFNVLMPKFVGTEYKSEKKTVAEQYLRMAKYRMKLLLVPDLDLLQKGPESEFLDLNNDNLNPVSIRQKYISAYTHGFKGDRVNFAASSTVDFPAKHVKTEYDAKEHIEKFNKDQWIKIAPKDFSYIKVQGDDSIYISYINFISKFKSDVKALESAEVQKKNSIESLVPFRLIEISKDALRFITSTTNTETGEKVERIEDLHIGRPLYPYELTYLRRYFVPKVPKERQDFYFKQNKEDLTGCDECYSDRDSDELNLRNQAKIWQMYLWRGSALKENFTEDERVRNFDLSVDLTEFCSSHISTRREAQ
ncbi:MAG: hypothetical protein A4S09_14120 [Proteobacteria bacterium SG_bin7]|nr:MAG: hypothetical protein A4S09_14120 [Proteobacteria bacterium SG_bin7]